MATERLTREYRRMRREHKDWQARTCYWYARNLIEWRDRAYWSGDAWYLIEHDGHKYHVTIEPDDDAWSLFDEDRENGFLTADEEPTYAYWFVTIGTAQGEHVDALGGIAGGYVDGNGWAQTDDELHACMWVDVIRPAIEQHAQADRDAWARHLETIGSD